MGYGDQITGVSDYCDWPESARNLPQLGTAQQPDLDAIRAEEPDVVITHTDLSENDLIALQQADIPVEMCIRDSISRTSTPAAAFSFIISSTAFHIFPSWIIKYSMKINFSAFRSSRSSAAQKSSPRGKYST